MKPLQIALALALLTSLALPGAAGAGGAPPPPLSSGFQVFNPSAASVPITIKYFDRYGANVLTTPDTIPAYGSKSYFIPSVFSGRPDVGPFSMTIMAQAALFILVNDRTASGFTPYVSATHSAVWQWDSGSPLYLPWVVCGYADYNSRFAIQNGGNSATTISVEFYQSGESTPVKTYNFDSVLPEQSITLKMTDPPYANDLAGFFGAVKIASPNDATPLAAILDDTNPTGSFLRSYNAVRGGERELIAPQVTSNYYGYSSGITLQNPAVQMVSATVRFYRAGEVSPVAAIERLIEANSATAIYLPSALLPFGVENNFNGAAFIESAYPLLGIVNHANPAGPAAAYNLIPRSEAAPIVYMPQIVRHYYNFESGYMLYNVGPGNVTVAVTFRNAGGSFVTTLNHTIAAGTALTYYLGDARGDPLGSNFNGSATAAITSGSGALVGIANFTGPAGGDNMQVYNLFH
jgi:hypothetical protein